MALMMMAMLNSVLTVIILGFILDFKHLIYSSHKDGDYDSCKGILKTQCKICDALNHRTLLGESLGECRCNNGTYDDGNVD